MTRAWCLLLRLILLLVVAPFPSVTGRTRLWTWRTSRPNECPRSEIQECTCLEVLQVQHFQDKTPPQPINTQDIRKGFRKGSKYYHSDKNSGEEGDDNFIFLQACRDRLTESKSLKKYIYQLTLLKAKKSKKGWCEEKYRVNVEALNEVFVMGKQESEPHTPREQQTGANDPEINRIFLFLDNSGSMIVDSRIKIGHAALASIRDTVERTPTSVHLIGLLSREIFRFEDSFAFDEIFSKWIGTGWGTHLWGYVHRVAVQRPQQASAAKDEVVIITDGLDNASSGAFSGLGGFNHMMTLLIKSGFRLRISILCIGHESFCDTSQYEDLCKATGGVFAQTDPQASEETQLVQMRPFIDYLTSSSAERDMLEILVRQGYENEIASGQRLALPWYEALPSTENGEAGPNNDSEDSTKKQNFFRTIDL